MYHPQVRLVEFDAALRGGQFPVRWGENLAGGYGYPLFDFYPPLSFALAEPFFLCGAGQAAAWKFAILISAWLGAAGMFAFLRGWTGRAGALAGAALYLFAPYHAMTLYVRGNLPEFAAIGLWPWAFWGLSHAVFAAKHAGPARWRSAAWGAIAIAAVPLAHVLTGYLAAWNLLGLAMFFLFSRRNGQTYLNWRRARVMVAAGLFALAMGAFFWIPALADLRYCRPRILTDLIRVADHFVYPWQFIDPTWGFGLSLPGRGDTISFQLGLALWAAVASALFVLWNALRANRSRKNPPQTASASTIHARGLLRLCAFSLAMLALHLVLMMPVSAPLWRWAPGASFVQFPWRLLIPATFWAAAAGGIAVGIWIKSGWIRRRLPSPRARRIAAALIIGLPGVVSAPYLSPLIFKIHAPVYTPEIIRQINTDTTAGEYLPQTVHEPPSRLSRRQFHWLEDSKNRVLEKETGALIRFRGAKSASYQYTIRAPRPMPVCFEVFAFPGWRVEINGRQAETFAATERGLLGWTQPAGENDVRIRFTETPLRRVANAISLISAITAIAALSTLLFARRRGGNATSGTNGTHETIANKRTQ